MCVRSECTGVENHKHRIHRVLISVMGGDERPRVRKKVDILKILCDVVLSGAASESTLEPVGKKKKKKKKKRRSP